MAPPRGRPSRRVVALWLLGAALVALFAVLTPVHAALYGVMPALAMLLGAGVCAAPALAIRHPRSATAVFAVAAFILPLTVSADRDAFWPWPWSVPALIAFVLFVLVLTVEHGWRAGLIATGISVAGSLVAPLLLPEAATAGAVTADLIVTTSIIAVALLVGTLLGGRIRLGAELTRERANTAQEQSRRELVEERTQIARELHDVVAHSMSLIQVQASTARFRKPDLDPAAVAEFEEIAASARTALTEMRRILGVLRTEDHRAELAPQRGVDDIPALVETTRRAGATVGLAQAIDGDVSAPTQIAAYRIVQESLSNAVRHAPGTTIAIRLTARDDDLLLSVSNALPPGASARPRGHGLRGMSERAQLLGGDLQAGPRLDVWEVSARLPRHPPITVTEGAP